MPLLLLQVPPPDAFVNVIDDPPDEHNGTLPVIATGVGFTVAVSVAKQPAPFEYVITGLPGFTPPDFNTPVNRFTVAIVVLLLLQVRSLSLSLPAQQFLYPLRTGSDYPLSAEALYLP